MNRSEGVGNWDLVMLLLLDCEFCCCKTEYSVNKAYVQNISINTVKYSVKSQTLRVTFFSSISLISSVWRVARTPRLPKAFRSQGSRPDRG